MFWCFSRTARVKSSIRELVLLYENLNPISSIEADCILLNFICWTFVCTLHTLHCTVVWWFASVTEHEKGSIWRQKSFSFFCLCSCSAFIALYIIKFDLPIQSYSLLKNWSVQLIVLSKFNCLYCKINLLRPFLILYAKFSCTHFYVSLSKSTHF